jgi:uncharacterized protein YukE
MYGDTDVMRKRAAELREQGVDIRAMADQLVAQVESVGWTGRAADDLRTRVQDRASHLRDAAARHEGAADSLEKHLLDVGRLQDAIADTERKAANLVADARTRLAHADAADAGVLGASRPATADAADEQLAAFDAPPPGHKDWLTVELPGL